MIDVKELRARIIKTEEDGWVVDLEFETMLEILDALEAAEKEKDLLLDVYRCAKRLEKYCVPCPEADDLLDSITHYEKYK